MIKTGLIFFLTGLTLISKAQNASFVWAKQIGGTGWDKGSSVGVDASGNIYATGYFENTVDFDPGPDTYKLTAAGNSDLIVYKLNTAGNFIWVKQMKGVDNASSSFGNSISLDAIGNIYTTGSFQGAVDFNPGSGIYNLSSTSSDDIFVHKMSNCVNSTSATINVSDCKSYTLNGYTYNTSGTYIQTIPNYSGCDSIITLNLTIDRICADKYVTTCGNYTWHCHTYSSCNNNTTQCRTYNSSGVYTDTVSTTNACNSIITLHLIVTPKLFSTISQSICNGQTYLGHGSSGTYIDTLVAANGCDSVRTLQLTVLSKKVSTISQSICNGQTYLAEMKSWSKKTVAIFIFHQHLLPITMVKTTGSKFLAGIT